MISTWQPGMTLEEMEKHAILQAFRFYRGNKTTTAQSLGIAIRTLDNKLEKYENDGREQQKRDAEFSAQRADHLRRARGLPPEEPTTEDVPRANAGLQMESVAHSSEKSAMPMPQRKEVQSVLPGPVAKSSAGRTR